MFEFFFFNDTATTEIYTLSLHDALPISLSAPKPFTKPLAPSKSGVSRPRSSSLACIFSAPAAWATIRKVRSEEHTSELQSRLHLVCRLLLETKKSTPAPSCRTHRTPHHR